MTTEIVSFASPRIVADARGALRVEAEIVGRAGEGRFRSPIGLMELEELRWYLEDFARWPADGERARRLEAALVVWGRSLREALAPALGDTSPRGSAGIALHFPGADATEAEVALMGLPWELLHDGIEPIALRGPLRRCTGQRLASRSLRARRRLRILLVIPRPEQAGLVDPFSSASAMLDALDPLRSQVEVTVLRPATLDALATALAADEAGFDVLHFDGHGRRSRGVGKLCFEHGDEARRLTGAFENVSGRALARRLASRVPPLAFLEACQSGPGPELDARDVLVAALIEGGCQSVVAFSHSVRTETTRVFFSALYRALSQGDTIAEAIVSARRALCSAPRQRHLQDWLVPVLVQAGEDHALVDRARPPAAVVEAGIAPTSSLPDPPLGFLGRWRLRLSIERSLDLGAAVSISGPGGQGKTALAVVAARWRARTSGARAAFVSLEGCRAFDGVLAALGRQLVGECFAVAESGHACAAILGSLADRRAIIVLDNVESALPAPSDAAGALDESREADLFPRLVDFVGRIARHPGVDVILTSRESFEVPGVATHHIVLAGLRAADGVELVARACRAAGVEPEDVDEGSRRALVEAVHGHPRSLTLLPPLLAGRAVYDVITELRDLMAELERRYPGDRERSLLASARLSADRLPRAWRERLAPLAVLQQGVITWIAPLLLGLDLETLDDFIAEMTRHALIEPILDSAYLRFHPALTALVTRETDADEVEALVTQRDALYQELVWVLYGGLNGQRQALMVALARVDLANLLAVLASLEARAADDLARLDAALVYAARLDGLLQVTPHAHARGVIDRRRTALVARREALGGWSQALCNARYSAVEYLLSRQHFDAALRAAEALDERCARRDADHPGAAYDRALVRWLLGRCERAAGRVGQGLVHVESAGRAFAEFPEERHPGSRRMAATCITDAADCLVVLGRAAEAVGRYDEAIRAAEALGDVRAVAVATYQQASARLELRDHPGALAGCQRAAAMYRKMGEVARLASIAHQMGRVHELRGDRRAAELAYAESLARDQEAGNHADAALTMTQLGNLAAAAGHDEEGATWARKAIEIQTALGDPIGEAMSRHNLGQRLRRLGRFDAAAAELDRSIALLTGAGAEAQAWMPWSERYTLERDRGDAHASAAAWQRAWDLYAAWRRAGGAPDPGDGSLELLRRATAAPAGWTPADAPVALRPVADALAACLRGESVRDRLATLPPLVAFELHHLEVTGAWP